MPKMKTKSGAKKRFRVTASGKVKFKPAFARHMQMNKPKSMKRKTRGSEILNEIDTKIILENFLPYARKRKAKKAAAAKAAAAE
ncbi:MAG: 50S ribosomal protein L35 [Micavibrio sp.]